MWIVTLSWPLVLGKDTVVPCCRRSGEGISFCFSEILFLPWHGRIGWKMISHLILFAISTLLALCLVGHTTEKGRCIVTVDESVSQVICCYPPRRKRLVGNRLEFALYLYSSPKCSGAELQLSYCHLYALRPLTSFKDCDFQYKR